MNLRRKPEGFNIAFLDIMSCGLGAVVLLFVLLKYDVGQTVDEQQTLNRELASLQQRQQDLENTIEAVNQRKTDAERRGRETDDQISNLRLELSRINQQLTAQQEKKQTLEKAIESTPSVKPADRIDDPSLGEESYLLGLKVEGPRIAIMVDHSASMTDENLVQIISRKARPDAIKQQGPKWLRTKKVVRWLLARLPDYAAVTVIGYSQSAMTLGPKPWVRATDTDGLEKIIADLENLVPVGPTNLQEGLEHLTKLNPRPTNLYLITDGLPTKGNSKYSGLAAFISCSSLVGKSTNISGECRKELFRQTLNDSAPASGLATNVILLPIEGDPEAAPEYWAWTARTGGLLISPAQGWP